MGLLAWIVVGIIAGWAAGLVMKGKGFGLFGNIIVGVIGALIGGWIARELFDINDAITGINVTTLVVAFFGAIVVLFVARLLKGR